MARSDKDIILKQTRQFYKRAERMLVEEIPMRTYLKHKYSTAVDVDLIEKDQLPEHKDIWVLNTARFIRKEIIIKTIIAYNKLFLFDLNQ